jgi:hypothetical protein
MSRRSALPACSAWIDPLAAIPALVIAADGVLYGWVNGGPTGAYAEPYRGARPPRITTGKLRGLAVSRGWRAAPALLRGRWRVTVAAETAETGGGYSLQARRLLGPVMLTIYADFPAAAGPYRWGWQADRTRAPSEPGRRGRPVIRTTQGELAEGATWPDVARVALREALALDSGVCASDNATRRGAPLAEAEGLAAAPTPEARQGAPVAATPAPVGQRSTRRPKPRRGTQSALFS